MDQIQSDLTKDRAPSFHYGYVVLFMSMLSMAGVLGFGRFSYTMILPAMRDSLGLHNAQMGLIGTMGFLGYLAMSIPGGVLGARFGARAIIGLALVVCGVGMMLMGIVDTVFGAILVMLLIGVGTAAGVAPGFAFASAWFVGSSKGRATGVTLGGMGVGMVAAGFLVPIILSRFGVDGWRWAWYSCGGITASLGVLCWIFLRNKPEEMNLEPIGGPVPASVTQESGSSLAWGEVYKSREMWRLCVITLAFGFAHIIYGTFFASYMQDEVGLTEARTGALWSLVGFLAIFSGVIGGFLSDRLGRYWAFTTMFLTQGLALLLVGVSHAVLTLYVSIALYGLSLLGIATIFAVSCADLFGPRLAPAAAGLGVFFFSIGQALGPFTAGILHDRTGSFSVPFLMGVVVTALGILATWVPFGLPRGGSA